MKALIVDDSVTMRIMLKHVLAQCGFQTEEAGDGSEAMRLLTHSNLPNLPTLDWKQSSLPDLITLDWNMPVMNGGATLEAIRQNHAFDHIKILVVSSETERAMVADALRNGTDDYLMKPFSLEAFYNKIELLGFSVQSADSQHGRF